MLLDLLGFIDSQSSPITRYLSETELVFKDVEVSSPVPGLKEIGQSLPILRIELERQQEPRNFLSEIYTKRFTPNTNRDFKSATAKLQRYSLIDEECWVPPVVHSWISHRLPADEKCEYIQWLVEEIWHQILLTDNDDDVRWSDFHLPPRYHELVFGELPQLRHARVTLNHASSKRVVDSMTNPNQASLESVELFYRLGRMLVSASRAEEGIYYLEKAVEGMQLLSHQFPSTVVSERRLQLAKARYRTSSIADAVREARSLSEGISSNRAAIWLAQCLQSAGELREASEIFHNIINILSAETLDDQDDSRVVFAAFLGAAQTLSEIGDDRSTTEARNIMDHNLIPRLKVLPDNHMLKVGLYQQVLIHRLELAADPEDQMKAVRTFIQYNSTPDLESLTGGNPLEWRCILGELRIQKKWSVIEVLGKAFVAERRPFNDLWELRWKSESFNPLLNEIDAWIDIHYRLGTAYLKLHRSDEAEKAHWDALGLWLGLGLALHVTPHRANLWRLQNVLADHQKDRSYQLILSYFGDYILEEDLEENLEENVTTQIA
jgi:tetratricopeptide (TPR) repeat protein